MRSWKNPKFMKYIVLAAGIAVLAAVVLYFTSYKKAQMTGQNTPAEAGSPAPGKRKALFYRNPMNPAITSRVPAKDQMGMDYIPVYEEEGGATAGQENVISRVKIPAEEIRRAGVQTRAVKKGRLYREIRTVGKVAYDPHLAVAEEEFISALKAYETIKEGDISEIKDRAYDLVESARRKLLLLGLSREQAADLEATRQPHTNLVLPGGKMWIYGDIYEYELSWVKAGEKARVVSSSFPGEEFHGRIASINPVLDPKTRSVTFRVEVDNPDLKLKPEMYADVYIMSAYTDPGGAQDVLYVPANAVLDTGKRKIVWVEAGNGEYEGRDVIVGPEASVEENGADVSVYPVLKGLNEGDAAVTKANFLIDSQSQITGTAASAFGGALGAQDKESAPSHRH